MQTRVLYGTRTSVPTQLSDGSALCATYKWRLRAPVDCAMSDLQFSFGNWYNSGATFAETINPDQVTLTASVEVSGIRYGLTFRNGQASAAVDPGATVISDPAAVTIPAGAFFYLYVCAKVASLGKKWPLCNTSGSVGMHSSNGEGVYSGADYTVSGTVPATNGPGLGPLAVSGRTALAKPSVLALGDSICLGYRDDAAGMDTYSGGDTYGNQGFLQRLFGNRFGVVLGRSGDSAAAFLASHRARFEAIFAHGVPDIAVIEFSLCDFDAGKTLADTLTALNSIYAELALRGVGKIIQTTCTPHSTSTDSWASVAGQTAATWETERLAFNRLLRNHAATLGLNGVIDAAAAIEANVDSGIGVPGWTYDGYHPNAYGCARMAAYLTASGALDLL